MAQNAPLSAVPLTPAEAAAACPSPAAQERPFPAWHYAMLNDEARNGAIAAAIGDLDLAGKTVVEIGAGSGVIAIQFARQGARQVIACEMNRAMAKVALQIIHNEGLAERITLLPMSSTLAIDQGLIPHAPDVIFTETVDCGVIGEGFFAIARDIRRIRGEHTIVLPGQIRQHGLLISSPAIHGQNHVDEVFGIDMGPLNAWATKGYFPTRAAHFGFDVLSRPQMVRSYDYSRHIPPRRVPMRITQDGLAHGLLSWFELQLGNHVVTNAPGAESHWHQAFHPLPRPVPVREGESLDVLLDDAGIVEIHA